MANIKHKAALEALKAWKRDIMDYSRDRDSIINLTDLRAALKDLNRVISDVENKIEAPTAYHFSKAQFLYLQDNIQYLIQLLPLKQHAIVLAAIKEIYL